MHMTPFQNNRALDFMKIALRFIVCAGIAALLNARAVIAAEDKPLSQGGSEIEAINRRLGRGINMGNMFEAPSEDTWGNPWRSGYFRMIAELGFQHVRIPVRWEPAARSMDAPPYSIAPDFMNRIRQVVDEALEEGLLVILNMHHHGALYEDPAGQRDRFLSQWQQIAAFFKDHPDSLLLELLNEPQGKLTAEKWNILLKEGLEVIRESNPTRAVLIGTAEWGGLSALGKLELPQDENIILTVHYYLPFRFTHQGASWVGTHADNWLGTGWHDTKTERVMIRNDIMPLARMRDHHGVPVHIGEFGAYSRADIDSRVKWTRFTARLFEEHDFSWAYWEFSAGFGIYNPRTEEINEQLVNALLHDELPAPTELHGRTMLRSDFSMGTDAWRLLQNHGSIRAAIRAEGSNIQIAIEDGGEELWHLQWIRAGITFEEGKRYRLTFCASADAPRTIQVHAGRNSHPWTAYSDYKNFPLKQDPLEFAFIFDMRDESDTDARVAFNLGLSDTDVTFYQIKIEELSFDHN